MKSTDRHDNLRRCESFRIRDDEKWHEGESFGSIHASSGANLSNAEEEKTFKEKRIGKTFTRGSSNPNPIINLVQAYSYFEQKKLVKCNFD